MDDFFIVMVELDSGWEPNALFHDEAAAGQHAETLRAENFGATVEPIKLGDRNAALIVLGIQPASHSTHREQPRSRGQRG